MFLPGALLAMLWFVGQVGPDRSQPVLAADTLDATPVVSKAMTVPIPAGLGVSTRTNLAKGPPVPPGEATPAVAGSANSVVSFGWRIECADCPHHFYAMTDRSLRLDGDEHPRIAYGDDHLYYAWQDGLNWHVETADHASAVGTHASLALDGDGRAHVSYYDAGNTALKYAYRDGYGEWHLETADNTGDVGEYTSLALAATYPYTPHISYYDAGNTALKYAYRDGSGEWHLETADNTGDVGEYTSLALDASGNPHISYYDGERYSLKYAYRDSSGGWHSEPVDSFWDVGMHTSLALDASGNPHISYVRDGGFGNKDTLIYAYKVGSAWYSETTLIILYGIYDTSLALDASGNPHIGFYSQASSSAGVQYAYRDASGWHSDEVYRVGKWSGSGSASLALDASEHPHISYLDGDEDDLKYAYLDGTEWYSETVDNGGNVGNGSSLSLDANGYPHISHFDSHNLERCDLKYTYQDVSGWHSEIIDSKGRVGEHNSLALDVSGYPHISYQDYTYSDLKYAFQDNAGWHIKTVDNRSDAGDGTSLALGASGTPHIAYYATYGPPNKLRYAYWAGSVWYSETVDSLWYIFGDPSLALDTGGNPHISYATYFSNPSRGYVKYAHLDATGWHTETVDSAGWYGGDPSQALDAGGNPHISYHDTDKDNLKYAYLDASGWHTETVDSSGQVSGGSSLALDGSDIPRISYSDSGGNLRYAWKDGDGWHVWIANIEGSVSDTSLALETTYPYTPHISYRDTTCADLMYATYVELPGPVANFTANPTSGFAPLTVVFTNTSTGDYTASLWSFGDGLTSTLTNPSHSYEAAGAFSVTLTVSGSAGMDTLTRTNHITVYEPVKANFTASPRFGAPPLVVTFTDTSSGPVGAWEWAFGDGATSTLQNPTHIYLTGTYTVSLAVRAAVGSVELPGGTDTLTRPGYITVQDHYNIYLPLILRN